MVIVTFVFAGMAGHEGHVTEMMPVPVEMPVTAIVWPAVEMLVVEPVVEYVRLSCGGSHEGFVDEPPTLES
jgi:hypothetical protein